MLTGASITYLSDPMIDFSLATFLDRFVYKKPKQTNKHQRSVLQQKTRANRLSETTVNSETFLLRNEEDIPVDELFFYKYFKAKSNKTKPGKEKSKKDEKEDQQTDMEDKEINYEDMIDDSEDGDFGEINFEEAVMQDISEDDSDINDLEEGGDQPRSGFASAEDFADLLDTVGKKVNPKLKAWEERSISTKNKNKPRSNNKRKR